VNVANLSFPADPQVRAFATQYTSLILILLTFILGTVGTPKVVPPVKSFEKGDNLLSVVRLKDLFSPDDVLEREKLGFMVDILKSHDVRAEVILSGNAYARAQAVEGYFRALGIEQVRAFEERTAAPANEAEIHFYGMQEEP
jgi:hypothetical protein